MQIEYVHSKNQFKGNLQSFITDNGIDFLTYTNADIDFVGQLERVKGFHVIRDPRDIAVSSYFSHLFSHPDHEWAMLTRHREKLQQVTPEEGLFLDIEFIHDGVFNFLEKWDYSLPNVLEIKMETLTRESDKTFADIFEFLGVLDQDGSGSSKRKMTLKELGKIIHKNRFSTLAGGRKPGEEDQKSHFRKGVPGDWANHFNEDHKTYFKDKYGGLLIKLGYEKDTDW